METGAQDQTAGVWIPTPVSTEWLWWVIYPFGTLTSLSVKKCHCEDEKSYPCIWPLCLVHSRYSVHASCFAGFVAIVTSVLQLVNYYLGLRVNVSLKWKAIFLCSKGPCDNKKYNLNDRECRKRNDFFLNTAIF